MTLENFLRFKTAVSAPILAIALAAGAARAQDLSSGMTSPVYAPPPSYSWTGFYAGLNAGGGFSAGKDSDSLGSVLNTRTSSGELGSGIAGGGQGGYNYQVSPLFLIGIENDFQATNMSKHDSTSGQDAKLPWFGTGRARAGVLLMDSRLFVYGTGGLAFGKVDEAEDGKTRIGWTVGGGTEWAFMPNLSAKLEYLYTDLYRNLKNGSGTDLDAKFNAVRVGLNYHFSFL